MTKRKKPLMRDKFFYFEPLKTSDKIGILIYSVFTVIAITVCVFGADADNKRIILFFYCGYFQLAIYLGLYVSLRNFSSYIIWFLFGIIHLAMFYFFEKANAFNITKGDPILCLPNTIILLLIFQLLRFASRKLQGREFVVPAKGGRNDLIENREISGLDVILFVIYLSSFVSLLIFMLSGSFANYLS